MCLGVCCGVRACLTRIRVRVLCRYFVRADAACGRREQTVRRNGVENGVDEDEQATATNGWFCVKKICQMDGSRNRFARQQEAGWLLPSIQ